MSTDRNSSGRRNYDRRWVKSMHLFTALVIGFIVGRELHDVNLIDATTDTIDYIVFTVKGLGGLAVVGTFANIIFNIYMGKRKR